jgi:hypothetical protein
MATGSPLNAGLQPGRALRRGRHCEDATLTLVAVDLPRAEVVCGPTAAFGIVNLLRNGPVSGAVSDARLLPSK